MVSLKELVKHFQDILGNKAKVIEWVEEISDSEYPSVTVTTWSHFPGHADVNVWANSIAERDEIMNNILKNIEVSNRLRIQKDSIVNLGEDLEKCMLNGKPVLVDGKHIFRKLLQVTFPQ